MGIKVNDIAFVRFRAPDLDEMEAFLVDFGLTRSERTAEALYMRGTDDEGFVHVTHLGDEPGFVGLAFAANTADELDRLASDAGFSSVGELDGPGGGRVVTATDPNGFSVEVIAGRGSVGRLPAAEPAARNDATARPRRGATVRLPAGPSHVKRLGHAVINVVDYVESEAWYRSHFGLVASDEIALDEERSLGAFLRCDQGERFVDHHTLFLVGTGSPGFNHAAFEVSDFDDLMAGHTHLANAERQHQWGIGRHVLGSQIFDYWVDPWGHVVEHWTDGDVFNDRTPTNRVGIDELLATQWGPTSGVPPS